MSLNFTTDVVNALKAPLREAGSVSVEFGEYNSDAAADAEFGSTAQIYYANGSNVFNLSSFELLRDDYVSTLEQDMALPGKTKFAIPQASIEPQQIDTYHWISNALVTDGNPVVVTMSFDTVQTFKGITIQFGMYLGNATYPTDFDIDTDTHLHFEIRNNTSATVTLQDAFTDVSTITITVRRMLTGMARLRIRGIIFGQKIVFGMDELEKVTFVDHNDCIGETLPGRELTVTVNDPYGEYDIDNPDSFLHYFTEGQSISVDITYPYYYGTSLLQWHWFYRYFKLSSWSVANHILTINAVDAFSYGYDMVYDMGDVRTDPSDVTKVIGQKMSNLCGNIWAYAQGGPVGGDQDPAGMSSYTTTRPLPIAPVKEIAQMISTACGYIPRVKFYPASNVVNMPNPIISPNPIDFTYEKDDIMGEITKRTSEVIKDITVRYYPFIGTETVNNYEIGTFTVNDGDVVRVDHRDVLYKIINTDRGIYVNGGPREGTGVSMALGQYSQTCYHLDLSFAYEGTYTITADVVKYLFNEAEYILTVNPTGKSVVWDNPLLDNLEYAQETAERLAVLLGDYVEYEYDTRGYPFLEATDTIYQENDFVGATPVQITEQTFTVGQSFSGHVKTRRAAR